VSPEPESYREDEEDEYPPQSIFAAGWFRAVLVLTVLAIVVVVSLPYLLNWFEPSSTPPQPVQQAAAPAQPAPPVPAPAPAAKPPESPALPPQAGERKAPEPKGQERGPAPTKAGPDKAPATPRVAADRNEDRTSAAKPARPAEPRPGAERTAKVEASRAALPTAVDGKRATPGDYWLQLGLFKEQSNAEALARAVRDQGFAVQVTRITKGEGSLPSGTYHLVRAGGFPDHATASKARDTLRAKGHQGFVTRSSAP
jgi:hypothetical protein